MYLVWYQLWYCTFYQFFQYHSSHCDWKLRSVIRVNGRGLVVHCGTCPFVLKSILLTHSVVWQASGARLGSLFQSLASIATGIIIAFVFSWEFALFIIGLSPFFLIAGYLEMKMYSGFAESEALEGAGHVSIPLRMFGYGSWWAEFC